MEEQSSSKNNAEDDKVNVGDVRKNWRMFEDFGVAYSMQQNEFANHYDHNRFERRTMHVDTKLSKTEQKLEDKYAAEYREQLRRDMEKDDERLALQLQKQIELEDRNRSQSDISQDEELARRLQEMEESRTGKRSSAPTLVQRSASGNRLVLPPGLTPETIAAIEEAQRDGTPLRLPVGISPEQLRALRYALKDVDQQLAQEVQDYELALYLQNKEKSLIEVEKQRRLSQEQVQNLQNQTYVAATKGTLIDPVCNLSQQQHQSMPNGNSIRIPPRPDVTQTRKDSDLINFDEEFGQSPPDPFSSPPVRPPPPRFQSPTDNARWIPPAPSLPPSVSLAGSDHRSTTFSPGNPFNNIDSGPDVRNRDPVAMGGIRVLPNNQLPK